MSLATLYIMGMARGLAFASASGIGLVLPLPSCKAATPRWIGVKGGQPSQLHHPGRPLVWGQAGMLFMGATCSAPGAAPLRGL